VHTLLAVQYRAYRVLPEIAGDPLIQMKKFLKGEAGTGYKPKVMLP